MATQTFVTDMQAINAQQSGGNQGSGQQQGGGGSQSKTVVTQHQTATIIQPSQAHGGSGQQFIVTIAGDPAADPSDGVQIQQGSTNQVVYQPQYVDDSSAQSPSDHAIYAASNGHIQYSDYGQTAMYTPVSGTYYQTTGSGQMTTGMTQLAGIHGQILTHQGGTYLVQGGTMDGEGHPLTHTTRASPATQDANGQRGAHFDVKCWQREVQWLIDNYETAEGVSLPRSTLYNHYLRHCHDQKIDPMNPASFGKLIRSVFLGLRTRRLGTRGNSKYHYYGIRIKGTSPLNQYTDDQTMAMRQQPVNQGKRFKSMSQTGNGDGESSDGANSQQQQHMQFLGSASAAIPNFGTIELEGEALPEGVSLENIKAFELLYTEHCEAILDIVVNLQFSLVEALWQSFWRNPPPDTPQPDSDIERRLPKENLYLVSKMVAVQKYVRRSDYAFYQALVEVLIPDVLRPIPSSLTQAIRNFAKSLETWLKGSMTGVPEDMIKTKVGAVSAFAQTLRRYTSLNHLAQAARAVLQNTAQINQMLSDLNRVDFANVQEQASWVCQCEDSVVQQLEQDFKKTLQQQNSLEQWSAWLEGVVNQCLKPHEGDANFPKAARQFLLKWSFYSSMVIRDLTLRSAASFGSFHLIRLLYDEYMFYLVEHKVAAATGETPIAVMGEVRQFIDLGSVMALGSMDSDSPAAGMTSQKVENSSPTSSTPISSHKVTSNHTSVVSQGGLVTLQGTPQTMSTAQMASLTANVNPATVTVVTASGSQPTKTIVVVPVSATAVGSGDAQPSIKRIKTN